MDNRQGKRKLYKNNLISEIPYQERRKVCMLLDVKDDWKKIVGLIKSYSGDGPRYDDIHVLMFEKEKSHRYGSPTDCLLNDWRSIRPKIGDLMEVLICANLRSVANYVSEEVLQEGKVNMPIQQADDGGSFASHLSSYEDDLNARGPNDFEPPSSMGYREHSLDPSMIASISGFATRHNIPVYSYEDLEQHTDLFNAEPLDIGGRLLGSGGYGKVFMGINKASQDRDVFAVKRFNDESLSHLKTLQSEMEAIFMNFKHPNLLPIRGVCYESHFCVLYEYMVEGTLDDHLSKKKESMSRTVLNSLQRISVAIDVARGIEHLHRIKPNPIVHRDIKPANILLGNDYQAKLGDFGLIRVQKFENNGHTNTTVDVHGTTMYMPPEAMTGKVSTKWDIYSFGVVLLELLFAKGPGYTEEDGHTIKLIEAVYDDDIFEDLPMHMLDPDCDWNMDIARQLVEFVEKCGMKRQKRPEISGSDNAVLETLLKLQATANRISR